MWASLQLGVPLNVSLPTTPGYGEGIATLDSKGRSFNIDGGQCFLCKIPVYLKNNISPFLWQCKHNAKERKILAHECVKKILAQSLFRKVITVGPLSGCSAV